jgi:hypothetical protein
MWMWIVLVCNCNYEELPSGFFSNSLSWLPISMEILDSTSEVAKFYHIQHYMPSLFAQNSRTLEKVLSPHGFRLSWEQFSDSFQEAILQCLLSSMQSSLSLRMLLLFCFAPSLGFEIPRRRRVGQNHMKRNVLELRCERENGYTIYQVLGNPRNKLACPQTYLNDWKSRFSLRNGNHTGRESLYTPREHGSSKPRRGSSMPNVHITAVFGFQSKNMSD